MNRLLRRTPFLLWAAWVVASSPGFGQQEAPPAAGSQPVAAVKDDPERQHALEVYHAGKFVEAMPLLEKLSADHPSDIAVKESLAFSVMSYAATLKDADLRKQTRVRARSIALEAKKLGDNSDIVNVVVDVPEDGSDPVFSSQTEVDGIMKSAEAEFVRGNFDKARDAYLHALLLDPKNYAPLFSSATSTSNSTSTAAPASGLPAPSRSSPTARRPTATGATL